MAERKTNRRQFLRGESAVEALSVLGERLAPDDLEEPVGESYLFQIGRRAMACQFQILLNSGQHPAAPAIAIQALDLVDETEDWLTVYRDDSLVQDINLWAGDGPVETTAEVMALSAECLRLNQLTDAAFDFTAGPLSDAWGFSRREGRIPTDQEIDAAMAKTGSEFVKLNEQDKTIHFQRADLAINFNSIGKGYALDRGGALFDEHRITDYLFHGGHSSILARGTRLTEGAQGWTIALRHPLRPQIRLGQVLLQDRALATSGSANQFFHFQGRRLSHVLDPRTGRPSEGVLSVTVLAPTAALADALATAFFVLGEEASGRLLTELPDVGAIFVLPGQRVGGLEIVTHNVDEEWTIADGAGASA